MLQKTILTILACFLSASLLLPQKATFKITGNGVGYTLLNGVVLTFEDTGTLTKEEFKKHVDDALKGFAADARKAKAEGKIDAVFFERFQRVLRVIKLVITNDTERILNPLIVSEVNKFDIKEKMGPVDYKAIGIGNVAGALAGELLSLKKYLDEKKKSR